MDSARTPHSYDLPGSKTVMNEYQNDHRHDVYGANVGPMHLGRLRRHAVRPKRFAVIWLVTPLSLSSRRCRSLSCHTGPDSDKAGKKEVDHAHIHI